MKDFMEKLRKNGIVDTRTYRYSVDYDNGVIKRIKLVKLDTTEAIDGWEIVKKLDEQLSK